MRAFCFRVTPPPDQNAYEKLRSIRGYRLLEGYRGHLAADLAALKDLLLCASYQAEAIPTIRELDLYPIFALSPGQGCQIVDVRVRVEGVAAAPEPGEGLDLSEGC